MGKDFLKLKTDSKKLSVLLLATGFAIAGILGLTAFFDMKLQNGCELERPGVGESGYEQELIVNVGDESISVDVLVEPRKLSAEEAEEELKRAKQLLGEILKGENENLQNITTDLVFVDMVPGTIVEVDWISRPIEYFQTDGTFREDVEIPEAVEVKVSAILSCQEESIDYEAYLTLQPKKFTEEKKISKAVEESPLNNPESSVMVLPTEYEGKKVTWRKPMDFTFLYFLIMTGASVIFLKAGAKRDQQLKKQEYLEALEKDYAQIVSKFTMLLSAGLSIRNAWERIVLLSKGKPEADSPAMQELNWGYREMQKGVSEVVVYERFGVKVGQVHYKKLMSMFISDQKRGSIKLLASMNQEMLQAWEEQKRKTKQQGEKIGTKLLLPMMGMLAVVFVIILVPAFLSFQL